MTWPSLVTQIVGSIEAHPLVVELHLVGSQRDGTSTPLSDWDFKIETADAQRIFTELPSIISPYDPLTAFWDPLGARRNYMAIFPGPLKLDLHLDMPPLPARPWVVTSETMQAVDAHFWDWSLWLAGKALKGKQELVTDELAKMHRYLLEPLGCEQPPEALNEAVTGYLQARSDAETGLGTRAAGNPLEAEVRAVLRRHGFEE